MKRFIARLRFSLSARLMLLFLLTGALLTITLRWGMGMALRHQFDENIHPHIIQYLSYIQQDLGNPPDVKKARSLANQLPVDIVIHGPGVDWSSMSVQPDFSKHHFRTLRQTSPHHLAIGRHGEYFVLRTAREAYQIYLLIHGRAGHAHGLWFGLLVLGIMLLILFLSYRAIRWMFQPIEDIQQGVQHIGQGELDHRITVTRKDELGTLGSNINAMANDIQKMLDAKRQLLLAISHELRSPITRARVSLELLDDCNPAREIRQDLQEMDALISELLETERLNTRHSILNKTPTSMNQLVTDVIGEFFAEQRIATQLLSDDPYFLLDAPRIKLLIKNLLENALRHNSLAGPPPRIELSTAQGLNICVRDHGAGVTSEHLPHLTEPFYRVDKSRQRKTGGYGLGLYLCRVIAEAHGGHLSLDSKPNEGTEVTAFIPVRKK